jgi:hypothetical protein
MTTKRKKDTWGSVPVPVKKPAAKKTAPKAPAKPAPTTPAAPRVTAPTGVLPIIPPQAFPSYAPGFTPFTPTTQQAGVSGVQDPNQPFGQGFGSDYGLDPTSDPNFAFGSGSTAPPTGTGNDAASVFAPPPGLTASPAPTNIDTLSSPAGALATGMNAAIIAWVAGTGPKPAFLDQMPVNQQQYLNQQRQTILNTPGPGIYRTSLATQAVTNAPAQTAPAPGNTAPTTPTTSTASTGAGTADQQSALATLTAALNGYGLGSMASWAWNEIVAGKTQDQILLDLQQTPQFQQRFPAIAQRQKDGLPALSPADYVNYESQATQLMRAAGLPSGFWDSPSDFTHLISSDVSINELQQRLNMATTAAYQVPADVRATLARDYGVGTGQLAAFFLDDKTALPLIQRDFTAAQIGGAAYRTGYGSTKTEDEQLTDLGVNPGQAQQGFTQLTQQRQLFSSLPGQTTTGISRDQQLQATFAGNAQAQEQIVHSSQERQAQFAGGGQVTPGVAQSA